MMAVLPTTEVASQFLACNEVSGILEKMIDVRIRLAGTYDTQVQSNCRFQAEQLRRQLNSALDSALTLYSKNTIQS